MNIHWIGILAIAGMAPTFNAAAFLAQYPAEISYPSTAILPWHFGRSFHLVEAYAKKFQDRPHLIQYYLSNGAARRGNRIPSYGFLPGVTVVNLNKNLEMRDPKTLEYIRKKTAWLKERHEAAANQFTQVMIAPELEDNLTDLAFEIFARQVLKVWQVPLIRSSCMGGKANGPAIYHERHGLVSKTATRRDVVTMDGVSIEFYDGEIYTIEGKRGAISEEGAAQWLDRHKNAAIRNLWIASQQGLRDVRGWEDWPPAAGRDFIFTAQAKRGSRKLLKNN